MRLLVPDARAQSCTPGNKSSNLTRPPKYFEISLQYGGSRAPAACNRTYFQRFQQDDTPDYIGISLFLVFR